MDVSARRAELAEFLRSRRAALMPGDVGLPPTARRRTPGLRREEVAELAGISVTLYTWLEQGRDVPVSERTIDAIAAALQMSDDERRHAQALAHPPQHAELSETITHALRRFVGTLRWHPTFVLDHEWNIVLRNESALAVFGGDADLENRVNMLEEVFLHDRFRTLFSDWSDTAEKLLEMYRIDFALYAPADVASPIVERLRERSPEFERWWSEYRVRSHPHELRELDHPRVGKITLEPSTHAVIESPGLRLLVFTPHDAESERRIVAAIEAMPLTPLLRELKSSVG